MYPLIFLGALASSALAQSAVSFSNTTFTAPVTVGATWSISFSAGNGDPVAIAFGNTTYAFQIVDGLAAPGTYNWPIAVPVNVVEGTYQLALLQGEEDPVFSPSFNLVIPPAESSSTTDAPTTDVAFPTGTSSSEIATPSTVTAIYIGQNNGMVNIGNNTINNEYVQYIYYDDECSCHQTSSCPASEVPTSMTTTTVTYSAAECGCTTTVEAPCAETTIPVAPAAATSPMATQAAPASPAAASPATNMAVAPASAASASAVAPAATSASPTKSTVPTYTGAAEKLAGSSFGFLAMVAALLA